MLRLAALHRSVLRGIVHRMGIEDGFARCRRLK